MPTYSELSIAFIRAMVSAMYCFEAHQDTSNPNLLTDAEMDDFYFAYMGSPQ